MVFTDCLRTSTLTFKLRYW